MSIASAVGRLRPERPGRHRHRRQPRPRAGHVVGPGPGRRARRRGQPQRRHLPARSPPSSRPRPVASTSASACTSGAGTNCRRSSTRRSSDFGRLDVLVNNAGMSPLYDSVDDITEDLFDKVISVNLKGPFRLAVAAGQQMVANGGSIINITSMGAVRPRPHILPYAAAKAGLNALTIGLAHTFGPTVRVQRDHGRNVRHRRRAALGSGRHRQAHRDVRRPSGRPARRDRGHRALPGQRRVVLHDRIADRGRRRPALVVGPAVRSVVRSACPR